MTNPDSHKNIHILVEHDDEIHHVTAHPNEYRNLMMLIDDRLFMEGFGECRGMGKCGTCLVEIISSRHKLTDFGRNEQATLFRAGNEHKNIRLSCQLVVDEQMDGSKIKVLL